MTDATHSPDQSLKIASGFVAYYRAMSTEERRAAMKSLKDEFCAECGVVHGDLCTCFKGWMKCDE